MERCKVKFKCGRGEWNLKSIFYPESVVLARDSHSKKKISEERWNSNKATRQTFREFNKVNRIDYRTFLMEGVIPAN